MRTRITTLIIFNLALFFASGCDEEKTKDPTPGAECDTAADCSGGLSCIDGTCTIPCAGHEECPDGTFCNAELGGCRVKSCSSSDDCTDPERSWCSPDTFDCREPVALVAPEIGSFRASPPAVVQGESTPVTWSFTLANSPTPGTTCEIDQGVGAVDPGDVSDLLAASPLPVTYTLTCANAAGSDTATVRIPALPSQLVELEVSPEGGTYDFGAATLTVPAGAVPEATRIAARPSSLFTPSAHLATLPVEFYPHGLQFLLPVTVTLPVETALWATAGWYVTLDDLHLATAGDGDWELRSFPDVNTAEGTLSATIGHFSSVAASDSGEGSCDAPPLSVPRKTLLARDEFLRLGGVDGYDAVWGQVHDDLKQTDRDRMGDITDAMGANLSYGQYREAAVGDFDDDGRDEVAVLTTYKTGSLINVRYSVVDSCASSANAGACWNEMREIKTWNDGNASSAYNDFDIAAGDVDGDGRDEIITATSKNSWEVRVNIWDDAQADFAHLVTYDITNATDVKLAVGDMDRSLSGDTRAEIAVAYTRRNVGQYNVWETRLLRLNGTNDGIVQLAMNRGSDTSDLSRPNVVMADIDNDGDLELVLARFKRNRGRTMAFAAYELRQTGGPLTNLLYWNHELPSGYYWDNDMTPLLVAVDQNGDGKSEVWLHHIRRKVVDSNERTGILLHVALGAAAAPWTSQAGHLIDNYARGGGAHYLAAGDLDGDLRDDLFVGELEPYKQYYDFVIYGSRASDSKVTVSKKAWRPRPGSRKLPPVMAVGDFDGDSLKLRFTGNCTTHKTDPRPVVVLAAPPVKLDVDQYREESSTDYGTARESSQTSSNSVSVSDTVTLSLEVEALGGLFSAETSTSFGREFTKTNTRSSSVTVGQHFSAPWRDSNPRNYVVYFITEYTSYEYEIIAAPDPDALTEANRFMTIDVPQGTERYATTVETYNSGLPSDQQIGTETFVHDLGDPSSYRTSYQCQDLTRDGNGWMSNGQYIGEDVAITESIEMSSTSATSEERSQSVEMSAGASIAGAGLSYSRGYSSSSVYEVSIGESTSYDGTVGGISSESGTWSQDKYKIWLVVYKKSRNGGTLKYTVVDYCVYQP